VAVGGGFFPEGTNPPTPWGSDTVSFVILKLSMHCAPMLEKKFAVLN